ESVRQLLACFNFESAGAQALGVGSEVYTEALPREPAVAAVTIFGAEAAAAAGAAQATDAREAVIVEHHDVQFVAFLDRGDDLLRHHEVGAVADHDVDFALGIGHLDAQAACDLIAHGGITVFEMVALRIARAPELVQVAGEAAGGAHHHVA